jgi:hypothetical protein
VHRAGRAVLGARGQRPIVRARHAIGAVAVSLGLLLATSVASAQAGDPSGAIILGPSGQSATQQQSGSASNTQVAGDGSVTLGNAGASNDQQADTNQTITQGQDGTFVVLGGDSLHQTANQNASTLQDNSQLNGGLVVGNLSQGNVQHATTNQNINQAMDGTFIVLGNTFAVDSRITDGVNVLNGCAECASAMSGGPVLAGGDLRQTGGSDQSMNGTYVVFGDLTQSASQDSSTVETNHQDSSGPIILGDTGQQNNQQAVTNQGIDQSLTGTYIVFGTLDQTADQNAGTTQINEQEQG